MSLSVRFCFPRCTAFRRFGIPIATQRSELAPGAWRAGDPDSVATVMDQAALRIATVVRGPRDEPDEPQDDAGARLAIAPMAGLPGDGARSLPAALRLRLVAAGVAVAEQPNEGDIVVNCQVTLRPLGLLQEATVVWVVSRNGAELGRITQQSHVPAGSLDGPWGTTATGIAEGATIGIIELFERRAETI